MEKIILASKSPRRKQLLEWAEIPFEIFVVGTDETFPDDCTPEEASIHVAKEKAEKVVTEKGKSHIILAADTMVVLDDIIIGKPVDREDAIRILSGLSGKTHKVITGVAILFGDKEITFSDTTTVEFHDLTKAQIEFYVDKYQPYDKAGAYAIQEWIGVVGIKSVNGDFYNVMGLPVSRVVRAINELTS